MASSTQYFQNLFQTASVQDGFFTAKQALSAGYDTNCHTYHVKTGNWIREHRGIYRLANYPAGDRPDLMLWYLWSRNRKEEPQSVYSYETSLALYELTDVNPDRLHITVPRGFRRNSRIPGVLVLHSGNVLPEETDCIHGVKVTNPACTINDIINDDTLSDDLLRQAISEAVRQGVITKRTLEKYRQKNPVFRTFIDKIKI